MANSEGALFQILAARGISRRWFAKQIGIHESVLSRIAKGKQKMAPQYRTKAALTLQLPESVIFFDGDVREGTPNGLKAS